jgi:hypothetical protein
MPRKLASIQRVVDIKPIRGLGDYLSFKVINPDFIMKHQDKERKENN